MSNTWTQKGDFPGTARYGAVGFSIASKGYIGMGSDGTFLQDFWEYDPLSDTWTQKPDFPGGAVNVATAFTIGQKGYVCTGNSSTGSAAANFLYEYDPATSTWTQKTDLPGQGRWHAVSFTIDNFGYVGTGKTPGLLNDFWRYDPLFDTWLQVDSFAGGIRERAIGFSINNRGYVGLGSDGISYMNDFWEFSLHNSPCLSATLPLGLTQGLISYWPFCGNANDETGNGNDGVVNGATLIPDRFGNPNSAYSFDGLSNFITVSDPVNNSLDFLGNPFSISVWIKTSQDNGPLITKQNSSIANVSGDYNMDVADRNGRIAMGFGSGLGCARHSTDTVNYDNWTHLVAIYNAPTSVDIYVNGVLSNGINSGIGNSPGTLANSPEALLFAKGFGNSFYNGCLDDIGIWNRVLSQQEVTQLYNLGLCFQTITVTDTLIINANLTGFNPITYQNSIKVYPNPSNDHITIDCGSNYSTMNGYTIRIDNTLGQTVYSTSLTQQTFIVDLNTWTGNGVYLIYLLNAQGIAIDVRKIVLQ
ncbi:MAG: T9SS type A sorting domain-containing protein [Chitinophagaceae bacterium]|nr:T9SS type A sorting domain-containing protein [Chitinophagaceae bacterium]